MFAVPHRVIKIRIVAHTCDVSGSGVHDADDRTNPAESGFPGDLAAGWSWDIAQLADGRLDVERNTPYRSTRWLDRQCHRRSRLPAPGHPSPAWSLALVARAGVRRRVRRRPPPGRGRCGASSARLQSRTAHACRRSHIPDLRFQVVARFAHAPAQATLVYARRCRAG